MKIRNKEVYYVMNSSSEIKIHVKGSEFVFEMKVEPFIAFCGGRIIHSIGVYTTNTDNEVYISPNSLRRDEEHHNRVLRKVRRDLPYVLDALHYHRKGVYVCGDSDHLPSRYNNSVDHGMFRGIDYEAYQVPESIKRVMATRLRSVFTKPGLFRTSEKGWSTAPAFTLFEKPVKGYRISRNTSPNSSGHNHSVGFVTICKKGE